MENYFKLVLAGSGPGATSSTPVTETQASSVSTYLSPTEQNKVCAAHFNKLGIASRSFPATTKNQGRLRRSTKDGSVLKFPSPRCPFIDNLPYNIVQTLNTTTLSSSTIGTAFGISNTTFALLDQNVQLGAVFDQYRIAMVEVRYVPNSSLNTAPGSTYGILATVVYYDDSSNLPSYAAALDYSNCLETEGYKDHKHVYVPHIAVAAYSGVFTSFANETAPWLDCSSNGVLHYGTKAAWTQTTNATTYNILQRVWFQFRNVR